MNTISTQNNTGPLEVVVDARSGFCFGVTRAIEKAGELLDKGEFVCSLGDIVHNEQEVERLTQKGMKTIAPEDIKKRGKGTVLFRAHGEPPESYQAVRNNGFSLADATCPIVLKLQQRVIKAWNEMKKVNGQVAIFGKESHPEVRGLAGHVNYEAIVIERVEDIKRVDASRPVVLFAQTTRNQSDFQEVAEALQTQALQGVPVKVHNTICRQVSGRVPHLQEFAGNHKLIIFVGGTKSSNARVLFEACRGVNANSRFVTGPEELNPRWFDARPSSIGVCGATSTPLWLMEQVADRIRNF